MEAEEFGGGGAVAAGGVECGALKLVEEGMGRGQFRIGRGAMDCKSGVVS